jgi:hypothetical protein
MNAIANEVSVLSRLRIWRGTLSGSGPRAQRNWKLASAGKTNLRLTIGAQTLPAFQLANLPSSAVGTSVRLGRITAGSTWRPREIDRLAQEYDAAMSGETPLISSAPHWSWLTARPLETSSINLDLLHAQRNDNGSARHLTGARGEWNAPLRWKVRGEWDEFGSDDATARAWTLGAAGPVRHPWGEANATAQWQSVQPDFSRWDASSLEAARTASLALQQGVAVGDVSGTLFLSVSQIERLSELVTTNAALSEEAQNKADLRWKLSPSLSLIGRHSLKTTAQRIETPDEVPAPDSTTPQAEPISADGENAGSNREAWLVARERNGEAGIEWKLSRSLGVTATAGQTRTVRSLTNDSLAPVDPAFAPMESEHNRIALAMQRRTAGGAWSIGFSRQLQTQETPFVAEQDNVQLAGERNLGPGLRVKGTLNLANNSSDEQLEESRIARSIEAQWSLSAGRIDVRVGDSNGSRFAGTGVQLDGSRVWAARLNLGSADKGNGLGLAVEYSQREQQNAPAIPAWRVGVTYK